MLETLLHSLNAVGVILVLDFFRHREKYRGENAEERNVNLGAVLGVVAGALAGNFIPAGIASVNAMIAAAVCYFAGEALSAKRV